MGRYFKRLSKILVISFVVIYGLIWLLSPIIIRYAVNTYGLPKPLFLTSASNIRYNPFTAHLTISDLEVKLNAQDSALKLQSLNVELDLHQLLFDKIYIAEFNVNGIFIPVTVNELSLNVAGIELRGDDPKPLVKEEAVEATQASVNFPYQVIIPEFTLSNANIELEHFSKKHHIKLDSFSLQNILLAKNEQEINLNLVSHLNGARIAVVLDGRMLKQQGQINVDLNAKNIDLSSAQAFLPATISALDGKVSYASKINIALTNEQTLININELVLAIEDLYLEQDNIAIRVKNQKIQTKNLTTLLPTDAALQVGDNVSDVSKVNIAITNEQTLVNVHGALVAIDDLHVEQNNIALDIKSQILQANDLTVLLRPNQPVSVDTKLNFAVDGVSAMSMDNAALLADISKFSINNIALKLEQNIAKASVENIEIAKSQFSKNNQQNMPALAVFNGLTVNDIEYTPALIAVDNVSLSGLVANVLLDKEKQLATLVAMSNNNDKKINDRPQESKALEHEVITPADTVNEAIKPAELVFKLAQFTLLDGAQISFKDSSVTPHYERNFNITHLLLSDIDSSDPEQEVKLDMQGKSDKYANFDIKGRGLPFAEQQKFNLNAEVKELSLPGVSSYIKQALKYEIESGQLDIKIAAGLTGDKLNGDVDLLLRGVEFTVADNNERGAITEGFSVPFNVALGMLKDSAGNVELSLPLKGDTSSPAFGFSGLLTLLVKQATMSAAKDYLITTFVPYASVMKVAMAAGEFALKLRINDLHYPASVIELNTEQLEFSRQMSVMLADRGNVNVKLCAIATASDLELEDASQAHLPENIARLKIISQQRVEVFKSHMVEQLKVSSARLLFCTPQIDTSKGAKPRIKFVI